MSYQIFIREIQVLSEKQSSEIQVILNKEKTPKGIFTDIFVSDSNSDKLLLDYLTNYLDVDFGEGLWSELGIDFLTEMKENLESDLNEIKLANLKGLTEPQVISAIESSHFDYVPAGIELLKAGSLFEYAKEYIEKLSSYLELVNYMINSLQDEKSLEEGYTYFQFSY